MFSTISLILLFASAQCAQEGPAAHHLIATMGISSSDGSSSGGGVDIDDDDEDSEDYGEVDEDIIIEEDIDSNDDEGVNN